MLGAPGLAGFETREVRHRLPGRPSLVPTRSYLISLPKIKDGSGQETRATRRAHSVSLVTTSQLQR